MKKTWSTVSALLTTVILLISTTACDTITTGDVGDDEFKEMYDKALDNFVREDYDDSISLKSLETEPESYMGKLVKYTGVISEIAKTSDNKADIYHLTVDNDSSKKIWAQTSASGKSDVDIAERGDTVNLYGIMYGTNLFTPVIYAVRIEKTDEIKGTRSNPYKLGETATYNGMDSYMSYFAFIAEVTATEVIRGEEASDMFDNDPDEGKEFFLVKFTVKALETKDDDKISLGNATFEIVNKDGVEYGDRVYATGIKEFEDIYAGGETEGYFCYIIDDGDDPLICFNANDSNTWFSFSE